ncbi:MAG: hypothetical protein LUC24_05460 [Bacteroidales bacterium]|nr:hypothetical protein [Bacteroidales bacterium]
MENKEPKITGVQTENTSTKRDRISVTLMFVHAVFIIAAVIVIIRVFGIWLGYKPDPVFQKSYTPTVRKTVTRPTRGSILTYDGKLLATSVPYYNIYMDCTAMKADNASYIASGNSLISKAADYDRLGEDKGRKARKYRIEAKELRERGERQVEIGRSREEEWMKQADSLAHDLARILGGRTAAGYYDLIKSSRAKGAKYVKICTNVDYDTVLELRQAHLFRNGQFAGGYIETKTELRQYPYDNLARKTIGEIAVNNENNSLIGLEGKYDYALSGREGVTWMKRTDHGELIPDFDSTMVKVRDGYDVRTTLNIEIQDIAHTALRKKILENDNIEGGCVIVMDVRTGAIRAMVNLERNKEGVPSEIYNYAIGRSGDPGSVFKLVTLMTLLEDKKIKNLDMMVPTYMGHWNFNGKTVFNDEYLERWPATEISIVDGFKISSNNVFRYLAWQNYKDNPKRFTDKISEYKLTEAYDFDLIGCATPTVPTPDSPAWSGTTLPSIAIGYSVNVTPLHIITLYNAVANKGKMMKPYLVEDVEYNGHVVEKKGPVILDGAICSQATADTLLRALSAVTTKGGTGAQLIGAPFKVAGKTGTARIPFVTNVGGKAKVVYSDRDNNRQHQATFVGFFPAEQPRYTAIVVMYSRLGRANLYGAAGLPVFRAVVDGIYAMSEDMEDPLKARRLDRKTLPSAQTEAAATK